MRRPRIIDSIGGVKTRTPRGRRVISTTTAAQVREMLAGVVEAGGTGSQAAIPGYSLAGKTGTANKIDGATGTYSKTRFIGSFVGFAPARNPKLLVTVMVDEPHGAIYGSEVAAPAFQEIMRFALPYLGIPAGS
jgi:cell division protein FtsI/penicillin-binding protein 2